MVDFDVVGTRDVDVVGTRDVDVVGTRDVDGTDVASPSTQMVVVMEMVSMTISHVVVQTMSRFSCRL